MPVISGALGFWREIWSIATPLVTCSVSDDKFKTGSEKWKVTVRILLFKLVELTSNIRTLGGRLSHSKWTQAPEFGVRSAENTIPGSTWKVAGVFFSNDTDAMKIVPTTNSATSMMVQLLQRSNAFRSPETATGKSSWNCLINVCLYFVIILCYNYQTTNNNPYHNVLPMCWLLICTSTACLCVHDQWLWP